MSVARLVFSDFSETLTDDLVCWIELESALVSVDSIRHLVVARFVESTEIEPNFGEVRVDSNRSRVGVESIMELIDIVVENSNRTPESWILAISVNSLLIRFVSFSEVARCHVGSTEEIPRERIIRVYLRRKHES